MPCSKTGNIFLCQGCQSFSIQKLASVRKVSAGNSQTEYKKVSDGNNQTEHRKVPAGNNPKTEYSVANGPVVNETCDHCGWKHLFGGPIWTDAIHSIDFIEKLQENLKDDRFRTSRRIRGMLQMAKEELPEVPLYHHLDSMAKVLRCPLPSMAMARSAILNAGYQVSYSHASKGSLKTDAPVSFLWNMFKKWIEVNPLKKEVEVNPLKVEVNPLKKEMAQSPGKVILSKPISEEISFQIRSDQEPQSRKSNMLRYQENPERNWGPKAKPPPSKSLEPDAEPESKSLEPDAEPASNSKVVSNVKKMKIDV